VRRLLEAKAAQGKGPSDWCYIYNFSEANKPRLLRVPAGRGGQLKRDMQQFVTELSKAIAAAFDSDEYRTRIKAISEAFKTKEENALSDLGQASGIDGRRHRAVAHTAWLQAGRNTVLKQDIETALAAQIHRVDRIRSQLQEEILRDTLLISVSDDRIGQINGLAVISLDNFRCCTSGAHHRHRPGRRRRRDRHRA
jgi:hypothetical protein